MYQVFQQAVYDLSDCDDLDEVCSLDFDEADLDRGWGLPPTPSLQHNAPLPPTPSHTNSRHSNQRNDTFVVPHHHRGDEKLSHHQKQDERLSHPKRGDTGTRRTETHNIGCHSTSVLGHRSTSNLSHRSITNISHGPVPLLPLNKLRSRDNSAANSIRSFSDISVLSLPVSRRASPTKRQLALVQEWGVKDTATANKLIQRSKKFGKHMSTQRKRELIRERILEGSSRRNNFLAGSPPPPSVMSAVSSNSDLEYQWDIPALQRNSPAPPQRPSVPLHVYRNPRFNEPAASSVRLPPLTLKRSKAPNKPKFK